jgi:hypothetical protein
MAFLSEVTAEFYPWAHPSAPWLRSNGEVILCTRCSARSIPPALDEDPAIPAQAFADQHLACPLGFGLRAPRPSARPLDPIFA